MGRPTKQSLDYFPLDVDIFQDIKIRKLIKYQGSGAFCVYTYLLCCIYKNGYFIQWDEELPFVISEVTGFKEAYVREVIMCCLSIGLLSNSVWKENRVITSKGIQERYCEICSISRRKSVITAYSLLSSEEKVVSSEEKVVSSEFMQQSKVNKSKVNSTSTSTACEDSEDDDLADLCNHTAQQEMMCMRFGITPDELTSYVSEFQLDCKCRETSHRDRRDAITHFNDWLRIAINAKKKEENATTTQRRTATKRSGIHAVSASTGGYDGAF